MRFVLDKAVVVRWLFGDGSARSRVSGGLAGDEHSNGRADVRARFDEYAAIGTKAQAVVI